MDSLNSMKQKLRPLGFYNLSDNSLISSELAAYADVLNDIEAQLVELERERYITTSESYGLEMRERILSEKKSERTIESRRNILLYRYSINPTDFNENSIKQVMKNAGIIGEIVEIPREFKIYINCLEIENRLEDKANIKEMIEEFLPAHLDCIFNFGNLKWDTIDNGNKTFDEMDAQNLTWDEIDNFNI